MLLEGLKDFKDRASRTRKAIHRGVGIPTDVEFNKQFFDNGYLTIASVHCSVTAHLERQWQDLDRDGVITRIIAPNEHMLPGIAAGAYLAKGEPAIMHMQNSGLPNAMDGIFSFLQPYRIPALALVTWRGNDKIDDSEPHQSIGNRTDKLTKLVFNVDEYGRDIGNHVFGSRSGRGLLHQQLEAMNQAKSGKLSCLRVAPKSYKATYPLALPDQDAIKQTDLEYYETVKAKKGKPLSEVMARKPISRGEAQLKAVEDHPADNVIFLHPNGFNAREAQGRKGVDRRGSLYNAGYMGGTEYVAWTIAKLLPELQVVLVTGDGNLLMSKMLDILSQDYPDNLWIQVNDNRIGESVGPSPNPPLPPWVYDLTEVVRTTPETPGGFKFPRVGAHGVYFEREEERYLAKQIGALPALTVLLKEDIREKVTVVRAQRLEQQWLPQNILESGIPPQIK